MGVAVWFVAIAAVTGMPQVGDDPNLPCTRERELNGSGRELRVRGKGSRAGDYEGDAGE